MENKNQFKVVAGIKGRFLYLSLAILFCCLSTIFSIFAVSDCQARASVYADSEKLISFQGGWLESAGEDSKTFKSFTSSNLNVYNAFINQQIKINVIVSDDLQNISIRADDGIIFSNGDAVLIDGHPLGNGFIDYAFNFRVESSGEYNLSIVGEKDDKFYFDTLIINAFDSIDTFSLIINDDFVTDNQTVEIEFLYNEKEEMQSNDVINLSIFDGTQNYKITSADYSSFSAVKSFSGKGIVLDTSLFEKGVKDVKINAKIAEKTAEMSFEVQDLDLPTNAIMQSSSITYLLSDEVGLFSFYLNKNSKPNLEVFDNDNVVSLGGLKKVESDKVDFDKFEIKLNLLNVTEYSNILFKIEGKDEAIFKVLGVRIISEVKSIKISELKKVYDNKAGVKIEAVVNGYDDYFSSIEWYVNDVKQEQSSCVFNFSPKGGTYSIYAQVGAVKSDVETFTVKYSKVNVFVWYIILAVCVVAMIVLYVTRKKKGKISMFGTLNENIDELLAGVRVLDNKYSIKGAKKLYRNMAIVKERLWHAYEENEEQLYKIANNSMQKAYKDMKKLTVRRDEADRKEIINRLIDELNKSNDSLLEYKRLCNMNENGGV